MPLWDGLKDLVINGASPPELKQEDHPPGHADPAHGRPEQVMQGTTSLAEVGRQHAPDRF
jgi:type IV pilus assembly protein PilB